MRKLPWVVEEYIDQGSLVGLASSGHGSLVTSVALWFSTSTLGCPRRGKRRWKGVGLNQGQGFIRQV